MCLWSAGAKIRLVAALVLPSFVPGMDGTSLLGVVQYLSMAMTMGFSGFPQSWGLGNDAISGNCCRMVSFRWYFSGSGRHMIWNSIPSLYLTPHILHLSMAINKLITNFEINPYCRGQVIEIGSEIRSEIIIPGHPIWIPCPNESA